MSYVQVPSKIVIKLIEGAPMNLFRNEVAKRARKNEVVNMHISILRLLVAESSYNTREVQRLMKKFKDI